MCMIVWVWVLFTVANSHVSILCSLFSQLFTQSVQQKSMRTELCITFHSGCIQLMNSFCLHTINKTVKFAFSS